MLRFPNSGEGGKGSPGRGRRGGGGGWKEIIRGLKKTKTTKPMKRKEAHRGPKKANSIKVKKGNHYLFYN